MLVLSFDSTVFNSINFAIHPTEVRCQFLFRWIYYCHSSKSTRKETGKTHLYILGQKTRAATTLKQVYTFPYLTQSLADGFPHLLSSWATADLIWHLARTLPCGRYLLLYIGLVVHNLQCLLQKISCYSLVMVLCMFLHTYCKCKCSM